MKAIIYCRVSTKDQADMGYSLPAQESACREYALRKGYEVVEVFKERGESAKTADRTELKKILHFCTKNHAIIDALLFYKLDRLSRNIGDYYDLVRFFNKLKIEIISITEDLDNTPTGKFMKTVITASGQWDNDIKSERTKNGMQQAIKSGRWCWRAPIGYKQSRDTFGKTLLIPSEESVFITKAFELIETGLYKQSDVIKEFRKNGFKRINEKRLNDVLRNPIYAGIIQHSWLSEPIDGIHRPLISKESFYKVQLLLDGKRPKITSYYRNHPDFPLRRFVSCPKCGNKLTGGWSTGRKEVKYGFYRCYTKGCSLSVTKRELEHRFQEHLEFYRPDNATLNLFEAILLDVWRKKQSDQIEIQTKVEHSIKTLYVKKDRLDELVIKGTMDDTTYKLRVKELQDEVSAKQIELSELKTGSETDLEDCLKYCKFFVTNFAPHWAAGNIDLKQRFQRLIFPDKIYYENGTFRTTVTNLVFKRLQGKSPDLSDLVALSRMPKGSYL
ncbi:MAG: recombinase family protein [Candidatus Omnitrophica bacterium]|nr:recombinase family protein [Candidatus Omnitrophota bacterium]